MEVKLVSIKVAAKMFGFPQQKLYKLVDERKVPFIELENLSGSFSKKINTRAFGEWLDDLARNNKTI